MVNGWATERMVRLSASSLRIHHPLKAESAHL